MGRSYRTFGVRVSPDTPGAYCVWPPRPGEPRSRVHQGDTAWLERFHLRIALERLGLIAAYDYGDVPF